MARVRIDLALPIRGVGEEWWQWGRVGKNIYRLRFSDSGYLY